jgi:hypothetical protein
MDSQNTSGKTEQFEIDPLGEPVLNLGTIRMVPHGQREITDHQAGALNKAITITAEGAATAGGAFATYKMSLIRPSDPDPLYAFVFFQDGPTDNGNFNGFTNESYLAILINRLRGFQGGKFACEESARALFHLTQGLQCLKLRTLEREERGVEGTHKT